MRWPIRGSSNASILRLHACTDAISLAMSTKRTKNFGATEVCLPDLMGLGRRHAARPRHRAPGPPSRARRGLLEGAPDHLGDLGLRQRGTRDGRVLSRSSPSTPASI